MNAKITLYSDKELIKKIKKYAKEKNTSVSNLVNEFFESLLNKKDDTPITNSLSGILKGKNISKNDYKKYLEDRYL